MAGTNSNDRISTRRIDAAFVLEQTLGHITHTANLRALVPHERGVRSEFLPIAFDVADRRLPGWGNWTIRAGVRANASLLSLIWRRRGSMPDVAFIHTQVPAVLMRHWMRWIPTVVSLDATPTQYDDLGESYLHRRGPDWIERMKHRANRKCFEQAAHLITWSAWAKQGLVTDYRVPPDKVSVIAPGVNVDRWRVPGGRRYEHQGPVRILFVGGDLRRKGGDMLIEAFRSLRTDASMPPIELHLATGTDVTAEPGISVHRGLTANSPALIDLYHQADIFCLPTRGDCLPMVLAEAAATGLPLVATDVGAIGEIVQTGTTGELIPRDDPDALVGALRRLITDAEVRATYGRNAAQLAEEVHDAAANAAAIVALLRSVSQQQTADQIAADIAPDLRPTERAR